MSKKTTLLRSLALATVTAITASAAFGQSSTPIKASASTQPAQTQLLVDLGSAERIQRSGSLRMLSQRIAATACNRVAGVAVEDADKYLSRSLRDYRRILTGMVDGDDGLGMYAPERDRLILETVADLSTLWQPLDETFNSNETAELTAEHIAQIAERAPEMLQISKELLGYVVAEYSDPSQMLQSDAVLLQIAERQRMLEQEIAISTCLIADGVQEETARAQLKAAIPLYERSVAALRNGLPEAGVAPPPTQAIDLWLADIDERWTDVRPVLDAIDAGGPVSAEDRQFIFEEMNKLTWMMNVTVGQYTEAAKLQRAF